MSKRTLRVAAILVCVCFVLAIAPVLNSAEKSPVSTSTTARILSLMKKPLFLLGSLLNLFPYPPVMDSGSTDNGTYAIRVGSIGSVSKGIVKTTEDGTVVAPPAHKD